jgi:hypothetical protein
MDKFQPLAVRVLKPLPIAMGRGVGIDTPGVVGEPPLIAGFSPLAPCGRGVGGEGVYEFANSITPPFNAELPSALPARKSEQMFEHLFHTTAQIPCTIS